MASWSSGISIINVTNKADKTGYGHGGCAGAVTAAIEAGGIHIIRPAATPGNHSPSAKDYGPSLLNAGFKDVGQLMSGWKKGDVVIFDKVGTHADGHMAIYDGNRWISDHIQHSIYAHHDYKAGSFKIYRMSI